MFDKEECSFLSLGLAAFEDDRVQMKGRYIKCKGDFAYHCAETMKCGYHDKGAKQGQARVNDIGIYYYTNYKALQDETAKKFPDLTKYEVLYLDARRCEDPNENDRLTRCDGRSPEILNCSGGISTS